MKEKEYEAQAKQLKQRLERNGIACEIHLLSEGDTETESENLTARWESARLPGERQGTEGQCGESRRTESVKPETDQNEVLWITDDASVIKKLLNEGCYVLALLHGQNTGEDFSGCRYACEELAELETTYLERVWRRYARLPWDILETERCLVRETTEEDVEDFYRIYSEPSITEYMEGLYEDPEQERAYAGDYIDQVYSFYGFGIWTVVEKESGQVIGRAGICYREGYGEPEIGFLIAKPWQKKGYATEVCRAVLDYAREELGFSKVLAFVHPKNEVSMHICKKLGLDVRDLPEG